MSGYQSGNMAGEIWVQWFSCCINQPAAHQRKRQQQRRSARVRIDRSMIGEPTNFQHTGHIGSGDVDLGNSHLRAIQNQMQSKGGYETAFAQQLQEQPELQQVGQSLRGGMHLRNRNHICAPARSTINTPVTFQDFIIGSQPSE
uniref:CRIB domain-containing protein n=1 Tax=Timema bartmani TaxID=61472 RepID=A0A7R9I085_9NEOP|nr:unnamed protein product [Timema bartmani]